MKKRFRRSNLGSRSKENSENGASVAGTAAAIAVPLALADDGDDGKGPTGAIQLNIQQLPR